MIEIRGRKVAGFLLSRVFGNRKKRVLLLSRINFVLGLPQLEKAQRSILNAGHFLF